MTAAAAENRIGSGKIPQLQVRIHVKTGMFLSDSAQFQGGTAAVTHAPETFCQSIGVSAQKGKIAHRLKTNMENPLFRRLTGSLPGGRFR